MSHGHSKKPSPVQKAALYQDPTIDACVEVEHERLWERIEDRIMAGQPLEVAREHVLADHMKRMHKDYGAKTANMVMISILAREPASVSHDVRRAQRDAFRSTMTEGAIRRHGRIRIIDRICLFCFGVPF